MYQYVQNRNTKKNLFHLCSHFETFKVNSVQKTITTNLNRNLIEYNLMTFHGSSTGDELAA